MKKQETLTILLYTIIVAVIKVAAIFVIPKAVENIVNHFKKGSRKKATLALPDKEVK